MRSKHGKTMNPAGITATFVSAVLSLMLPASAMSAGALPLRDPVPVKRPSDERAETGALRNDPALESRWGAGDPDLVVREFHFDLADLSRTVSSAMRRATDETATVSERGVLKAPNQGAKP